MKALTNEERPGHQKSLSSRALVQKCSACPVVGESCMDRTMGCRLCGGIYMWPLKYRWRWSYASHPWTSKGTGRNQLSSLPKLEVQVGPIWWRTKFSGLGQGLVLG